MALIPCVWMNFALRKGMYFLQEETLCRGENGYASVPTTSFVYSTKSCFIAQSLLTTLLTLSNEMQLTHCRAELSKPC